jgi:hypothetical protein
MLHNTNKGLARQSQSLILLMLILLIRNPCFTCNKSGRSQLSGFGEQKNEVTINNNTKGLPVMKKPLLCF